jgi:hypothetical protein
LTTIGFPHTIAGLRWIEEVVENLELTPEGGPSGPGPETVFRKEPPG